MRDVTDIERLALATIRLAESHLDLHARLADAETDARRGTERDRAIAGLRQLAARVGDDPAAIEAIADVAGMIAAFVKEHAPERFAKPARANFIDLGGLPAVAASA